MATSIRVKTLQPHQRLIFLKLSFASLCLAIVCVMVPGIFGCGYILQNDHDLLLAVGELFRNEPMTEWMLVITKLGSSVACLLYCCAAGAYFWWKKGDRISAVHLTLAWVGSAAITKIIKEIATRARPELLERLGHADGYSFPSGHSLSSATIFTTFAILAFYQTNNRSIHALCFGAAIVMTALVAFSRVYLAVHFPSDVIAGVLLGITWALALGAIFTKRHMQRNG